MECEVSLQSSEDTAKHSGYDKENEKGTEEERCDRCNK